MGDWRKSSVAELQREGLLLVEDGNHGEYRPRPDEFVEQGVAFIRAADIDAGQVLFTKSSKINNRAFDRITKGIGKPGDILLSHKGTVGKLALVPDDAPSFVCSPQTTFWRTLDERVINKKFLYFLMMSPFFCAQLSSRAAETDMAPYVSLTSQRGFEILLPVIQKQEAIAAILGSLDNKIDLNRRMNETLEAMARAIFKDWFVDFGPTRAKMEGRAPYLAREIWDLFPDRLDEEGKPEGWEISAIGREVEVVGGSTPSTKEPDFWDGEINWATPKDLSALRSPVLLETGRRITAAGLTKISSGLLPAGTVLLSSRAPIGYVAVTEIPLAINQGFIAMRCNARLQNAYVWLWTLENMDVILQKANGSTFQEISKGNFRPIPVLVPNGNVLPWSFNILHSLYKRISSAVIETRTLAQTRDLLLPKLMSGEIRIKDAEKTVENIL